MSNLWPKPILLLKLKAQLGDDSIVCLSLTQVGDVSAEMVIHALDSLCTSARMTVHVRQLAGGSCTELVAATARALGLTLRQCAAIDPRRAGSVTSSKGTLSV